MSEQKRESLNVRFKLSEKRSRCLSAETPNETLSDVTNRIGIGRVGAASALGRVHRFYLDMNKAIHVPGLA